VGGISPSQKDAWNKHCIVVNEEDHSETKPTTDRLKNFVKLSEVTPNKLLLYIYLYFAKKAAHT